MDKDTLKLLRQLNAMVDPRPGIDIIKEKGEEDGKECLVRSYLDTNDPVVSVLSVLIQAAYMIGIVGIEQKAKAFHDAMNTPDLKLPEGNDRQQVGAVLDAAVVLYKSSMELVEYTKEAHAKRAATASPDRDTASTGNKGEGQDLESMDSSSGPIIHNIKRDLH